MPLAAVLALIAVGWTGVAAAQAPDPPRLEWRAPEALAPQVQRLDRFDARRLLAVMRLVGLEDAGPPIPIILVPEDAPLARQTPAWVAAFATGGRAVVLFPARTPSYPHDSVEQLLQHEVAHVLIARAAGGGHVPRWFHEGVALAAERTWTLGDRAWFALDVAFGGKVAPSDHREYGHAVVNQGDVDSPIFGEVPASLPVWMSHGDRITQMPSGFRSIAYSDNSPVAVMPMTAILFLTIAGSKSPRMTAP